MASEKERVLLFKNPTGGGLYAQALLTVLCSPPGVTVKLTTYRSIWVSKDIFRNPKCLENRKALMICVDAEKDKSNTWWVKNFYPIREINIKKSELEGDYLALWVEIQGYVLCKDYNSYTDQLRKSLPRYPPDEESYIAFDEIRDLSIIPPEEKDRSLSTWQNLVEMLNKLKAFENAAFYILINITQSKEKRTIDLVETGVSDPARAYNLTQGKDYTLLFSHLLPSHDQREGLGRLEVGLHLPSWVQGDQDSFEIFGRQDSHSVTVKVRNNSLSEYATIKASPKDPNFKIAPNLSIPIKFRPRPLLMKLRRRLRSIIAIFVAVFIYGYAQLAQAIREYPTIDTLRATPELIGAILSSIMLIVIPILISPMIGVRASE